MKISNGMIWSKRHGRPVKLPRHVWWRIRCRHLRRLAAKRAQKKPR